jgi:hypothetical protein
MRTWNRGNSQAVIRKPQGALGTIAGMSIITHRPTIDEPAPQLDVPLVLGEVTEGVVTRFERVYTFDRLRGLCEQAPMRVRRARAYLFGAGSAIPGVAEATLTLDDGSTVHAVGEGTSMREAVDLLASRLGGELRACGRGW